MTVSLCLDASEIPIIVMPQLIHDPEPADHYLRTFNWNKVKYRADKPIGELIESLQKVYPALPQHLSLSLANLSG